MANISDVAKKQYNIRLEEDLIKKLEKLAKADNRTTSNYIEKLLLDHTESIPISSKKEKK